MQIFVINRVRVFASGTHTSTQLVWKLRPSPPLNCKHHIPTGKVN